MMDDTISQTDGVVKWQAQADAHARMIWRRAGLSGEPPPGYVRSVKRGRYDFKGHYFTLPAWLWADDCPPDFLEYYVAHELAHGLVGVPGHGSVFQLTLWSLAPDVWHYEAAYKPRHYCAAHACIYSPPRRRL